jgi:hypothetical protein
MSMLMPASVAKPFVLSFYFEHEARMLLQPGRAFSKAACRLPLFSGLETCGAHGCPNVANHDLVATSAVMHALSLSLVLLGMNCL